MIIIHVIPLIGFNSTLWKLQYYLGFKYSISKKYMLPSDVDDAEPRLLVFDTDPILSFSQKNEPSRAETLAKRSRAELRLLQTITEPKLCLFEIIF